MKRGFLITGLMIVNLFLVIGLSCEKEVADVKDINDVPNPSTQIKEEVVSVSNTKLLVDRDFILDGTNPPFDLITRTILQEAGKGLRIEVTSNNPVSVELTDAKGCLSKVQGGEYNAFVSESGTEVSFDYTKTSSEDMNNCVAIQSVGKTQVELGLKVNELTF